MDRRRLGAVARGMDLDLRLSGELNHSDARSSSNNLRCALFHDTAGGSMGPRMGA